MVTWLDFRKSLRMRINHPFCISGKNCDKFGIAVYELGHVVGFQEKSAHGHVHKLSYSVFQEKTAISLA